MDSEKWQKVKTVFEKVVDLPPAERSRELMILTDSNQELRAEVESLLQFDSQKQVICNSATPLEGNTSGASVGQYRLNFPLAINEKTEVWQAVHESLPEDSLDRKVAIKFFKDIHGNNRREMRFRQEASILSRFNHPSIARFVAEGETESGVPWFSTSYVEGLDLITMADRMELGLENRLDLFDQVCAALEYSHRFLVIHRDVKPGNIVVDETGNAVLIDFGISKQLDPTPMDADQLTRTFERTLTPAYASPEQLRGEPVSAVTDVYGAGLVLYELISGHHAYSDTVHQGQKPLFDRILFELPIAPTKAPTKATELTGSQRLAIGFDSKELSRSNPDVDSKATDGLDRIVMKAITKVPDQRYQSITEFRRDIAGWRAGEPIADEGILDQELSWVQRNAVLCSVSACLLGAALTFGLMALLPGNRSDSQRQLQLLENISNSTIDFDSLVESDWSDLGPLSKLSLADLAMRKQKFGNAVQIANEVDASQFDSDDRFKIARLWDELGFPERAFNSVDLDAESFEDRVESDPSIEQWRRLLCKLHMGMGQPTLARTINDSGLRTSAADRFERELTENEIREASKWFEGLGSRLNSSVEQLANSRISADDRRDFADLMLRCQGSETELKQALLELDDRPGEWSRSKAKLALAKLLLEQGDEVEGKTLLVEIVREFVARQLPTHPIVLQAWSVADLYFVRELDLVEWWNQHGSDLALSHPNSLEVFAAVVKWDRDHLRHYQSLRPWLEKMKSVENGPVKVAVLREIWKGAIESDDSAGAALVIDNLLKASKQYIDDSSLEYAEALVITSSLERFVGKENSQVEARRFEKVRQIRDDAIRQNQDSVAVSFLVAIDMESPDSLFKAPANNKVKTPAGWIREFVYHHANRTVDQLEMVAWFCEFHSDSNPEDVQRLIKKAVQHRDAADWGPNGDVNWKRVEAVKLKVNR